LLYNNINNKIIDVVYTDKLIYEYIYLRKAVDSLQVGYEVYNEIVDAGTLRVTY